MFKNNLFLICILPFVLSEETKTRSRQAKFFSFNAESQDIDVGLDFSIPFIKIPMKKPYDVLNEFGIPNIALPKININPVALVLGGLIIAFTSISAPFVSKAFDGHYSERFSRNNDDLNSFQTLYFTEQLLANSRACPERVACWTGRRNKNTEVMKTWKQIMSNKLLSTMVNTTALKEATLRGIKGQSCDSYIPCPIEEKNVPMIMKNFAILTNSK